MSESSYVPNELAESPCGYICKMGMPKLDAKDIPKVPVVDIVNEHLASLVSEAHKLIASHALFPTDMENRLRSSAIFTASDDEVTEVKAVTLQSNVYESIREFK